MKILILNGPNLNLLGKREPQIYGNLTFDDYFNELKQRTSLELDYFQSNTEGEIIDRIQQTDAQGIILNAGGYTHTSVAIRDCIASVAVAVVEVHISNIMAREDFRHTSMISAVCAGCIFGFGMESYALALRYFENKKN